MILKKFCRFLKNQCNQAWDSMIWKNVDNFKPEVKIVGSFLSRSKCKFVYHLPRTSSLDINQSESFSQTKNRRLMMSTSRSSAYIGLIPKLLSVGDSHRCPTPKKILKSIDAISRRPTFPGGSNIPDLRKTRRWLIPEKNLLSSFNHNVAFSSKRENPFDPRFTFAEILSFGTE